jgi:uncharacterized membrane protein HdeD (DUF308 family)
MVDQFDKTLGMQNKIGEHWIWALTTGVLLILLGGFGLTMPVPSTVGLTFAIATLLLASGAIQLVHAVKMWKHRGETIRFLQAFLALAGGGLIFRYPESGVLGIALVLSLYFIISAAMQVALYMSLVREPSRYWVLLSSISSFVIGVYLIATFPFSALWVPGLLVGVDLIFAGVSLIGLAISARSTHKRGARGVSMRLKPTSGVL